jgi:hypothetical protein
VLRGGGWNNDDAENFSASNRNSNHPTNRNNENGFRCAKTMTPGDTRHNTLGSRQAAQSRGVDADAAGVADHGPPPTPGPRVPTPSPRRQGRPARGRRVPVPRARAPGTRAASSAGGRDFFFTPPPRARAEGEGVDPPGFRIEQAEGSPKAGAVGAIGERAREHEDARVHIKHKPRDVSAPPLAAGSEVGEAEQTSRKKGIEHQACCRSLIPIYTPRPHSAL